LVVIGLRADFYDRTAAYPELVPHLQDRQVLVGPIDEAGLREAIEKPAASAGLIADAALVEVLLADLGVRAHPGATLASTVKGSPERVRATGGDNSYAAGRLALLSYALQQTWRNRDGRRLTVAGYRATGGIDGAVAQAADSVYNRLGPAGQDASQRVLLRLVTLGEGTPDSRRRASPAELTGAEDNERAALTRQVLADLIDARLVTADEDTVEITHEALLTAWPRLHQWLTDDRAGLRIYRDLTDAARDWQLEGPDPSRLFRGTRLAVAQDWATRHGQDLNVRERAFLTASRHDQLRASRRRRFAIAVLLAVTLTAITFAGIAVHNADNATRQADNAARQHAIALSRQLAAESLATDSTDPMTARQLAVAAWHIFPTNQADSAMTTLLAEQQQDGRLPAATAHDGVNGVAFSPDGKLLASADGDGTVWLWNPATGQRAATLHATSSFRYGVPGVAFSPDGALLASADTDGTVRLWNPATGQPAGAPIQAGAQTGVVAVAFSPNGKLLASASDDGTVRLWQVSLFAHPYAALCADVGPPTPQEWNQYASGEPQPKVCG